MFEYTTERKNHLGRKLYFDAEGNLVGAECSKCGESKNIDDFGKSSPSKYGIRSQCRMCSNKYYRGKENEHAPLIYEIQLENAVYIGQTTNISNRKKGHINKARNKNHCIEFIEAYEKNPEAFKDAVEGMKILKQFSKEDTPQEISEYEYNLQIDLMLQGKKVLGRFEQDVKFKQHLITRLGGIQEIINLYRGNM